MTHRIAIASTDGESIDLHFAQAHQFYIYDVADNGYTLAAVRQSPQVSSHDHFDGVLAVISDCSGVIASRIGYGAAQYLATKGLRVFEAPYPVRDVLRKLVAQQILNQAEDVRQDG